MQVATGDGYRAAAAEQSVRDVVVQPARGLIVDDMGRPLVANRSSWVVSLDRTLLGKLPDDVREKTLRRLHRVVHVPVPRSRNASCCAGSPAPRPAPAGTARPTSRCPSRATSRRRPRSRCSSSPRTTPECWPSRRACAPTPRRTASTARTCSATSARSPRASSTRPSRTTTGRSTAPQWSAGPASRRRTTPGCVASPATRRWPWTPWVACSATPARSSRHRGTPWSPRSTRRSRPSWRSSSTRPSRPRVPPPTPSPGGSTPRTVAQPSCSTPRPVGWSRWRASRRTTRRSGQAGSPPSS